MSRKHYKRKKRAKEHAPDVKLHAERATERATANARRES